MNRFLLVVLDDFELGVVHADSFASQTRFSKDNQLLSGGDHFLDVMQVEPAADQRLAQRVRARFLQSRLENFSPTAEAAQRSFNDFAAQTNRLVAFFTREFGKRAPIFVASWKMREQMFYLRDTEPAERENLRARNPLKLFQRLRNFHQTSGADSRTASTRISTRVSPSYSSGRTRNAMSHGCRGSEFSAPPKKIARR